MRNNEEESDDRRGTESADGQEPVLDLCDQAHVAETYRLESADDACDDGIK